MASNYRPISLTCILANVFEKILRNHILSFVAPMIAKQQHGYLPGKSCVSNLLECMDTVNEILTTDKQSVDILYLNFQKAFHSVPHKHLLDKLKAHGITGKTHAIVKYFLSERGFKVRERSHMTSARVWQISPPPPCQQLSALSDPPDDVSICQTPPNFKVT